MRKIKCIAVGPAAGRIMNKIISSGLEKTDVIVIDTDPQALNESLAKEKVFIDPPLKPEPLDTSYFSRPSKERMAELRKMDEERFKEQNNILHETVIASKEKIKAAFSGADLIIIICCMGTAKGLVIAPEVAKIAKDMNIPAVAILSTPPSSEGNMRMGYAEEGINKIRQYIEAVRISDSNLISHRENAGTLTAKLRALVDEDMKKQVEHVARFSQKL